MHTNYTDRWALPALGLAALIMIALFLASLAISYYGDEYARPAWDEQSVPAARTY